MGDLTTSSNAKRIEFSFLNSNKYEIKQQLYYREKLQVKMLLISYLFLDTNVERANFRFYSTHFLSFHFQLFISLSTQHSLGIQLLFVKILMSFLFAFNEMRNHYNQKLQPNAKYITSSVTRRKIVRFV